ncbi:MAG: 4-oxalocrotonate tautomerase family protein [Candidatus Cloacimonetes bacterium]|nr:4-oxalocrotonate tautomerase family protein [Candidatus Cloacimonadota bacterium]
MPIITIENAGELTIEQKNQLIRRLTDAVSEITKKPEHYIYVKIVEIPRENFGIGGKSLK